MAGPKLDWECVSVCLFAFAVYVNTLDHGFVYDDNRAILTNLDVLGSTPLLQVFQNDFWGTPLSSSSSHGSYRPLCTLSFRLNHWLTGLHPRSFHLINVLLHVLATSLVLRVSRVLLPVDCAPLAALLFAVHPVHVEAVTGVVGRADVLAAVFFLSSFLLYVKHVNVRDKSVLLNAKECLVRSNNKTSYKTKRCSDILHCTSSSELLNELRRLPLAPRGEKLFFSFFLVLAVCAVLSKETGITVIPLAVCYDVILHMRSRRISSYMPYVASSVFFSVMSFFIISLVRIFSMGLHTPVFSTADNPTAKDPSLLTRTLTFFYLPIVNLLLLFCPQKLSFDWSMDAIPRITTLVDLRCVLTAVFYYTLFRIIKFNSKTIMAQKNKSYFIPKPCKVCGKGSDEGHHTSCRTLNNNNLPQQCNCNNPSSTPLSKGSVVTMCLAFTAVPLVPASNLFFYVGFVVAERVLYISSIGFCMLVAVGVRSLMSHCHKHVVVGGLVILLITLSARTVMRNKDWRDEESLYRSAIHINPPKAYGNLGSVLGSAGRLREAEAALRLALTHRPNMADVHYNLGNLLNRQNKHDEAVQHYKLAIQYRPSLAVAYLNLGQTLEAVDRWPEVESAYRACCRLRVPGLKDPRAHENARGSCCQRLSALCGARQCEQETEKVTSNLAPTVINENGVNSLDRRLSFESKDPHYRLSSNNKTIHTEREKIFLRALQKSPNDPALYVNYGQLLVQLGRATEAASLYVKAARLEPAQHALVTSAAIALRQVDRLAEAELLYRQACELKPLDAASHSNLGAILHLQGKYRPAAASYKEALRLAPSDPVTLANLQRLRNLLARNKR